MKSIYTNADPSVLKLFEQAGNLRKVLCAPLDYAKKSHAVMFCNGVGDILKKAFHIPNSEAGVEKLLNELKATCRHRSIKPKHVFFGGEDTPAYAENFVGALRKKGFLVARVNAYEAKKQRATHSSTDFLDVNAIAELLLKGRARMLSDAPELHQELRALVRERHYLVETLTATRNRMHPHVDRLFPGFLNPQQSKIQSFGPACYHLLADRFSAPQIARRNVDTLVACLEKHRVPKAAEVAEHLKKFAAAALAPNPRLVPISQLAIKNLLEVSEALEKAIATLQPAIAELLAQSPGARLTTVPGIGVTLAAGLTAEIFLMEEIPGVDRICSYAGIIPATYQTGGEDKAPYHKTTNRRFNHRLKNYLLQAGDRMAAVAGTDAYFLKQKADEKGQHPLRVMGKHVAGIVRCLLLNERAYLPQKLYHPDSPMDQRATYLEEYWPKLRLKWGGLVPLPKLFDPAQPLGRWRKVAQTAYGISLPLPGSKREKETQQKDSSNEDNETSGEETTELI